MANKKQKKQNVGKRKLTREQMAAKEEAARKAQEQAKAARERSERTKKIFTVIICIILVLALGIPTVALSVLGMG